MCATRPHADVADMRMDSGEWLFFRYEGARLADTIPDPGSGKAKEGMLGIRIWIMPVEKPCIGWAVRRRRDASNMGFRSDTIYR